MPKTAPYGSWKSPISSDLIVAESIGLYGAFYSGDDIYWLESRPSEGGRNVLVKRTSDGRTADITPQPFNVRTLVHEYGGGACAVHSGTVYFSNYADQRLYRQDQGSTPRTITPEVAMRYADFAVDPGRNLLFCVREDHREKGEAVNTLVKINCQGDDRAGTIIVEGSDFYSNPRLSPDGSSLAWLSWNHPNMPWDGCELWVGELEADGSIAHAKRVAGGYDESIFQPEWSPDGTLYFVSDQNGWWNLYRLRDGTVEALCPMEAEFGKPMWQFGANTYAPLSAEQIICTYSQRGVMYLASLNTRTLELKEISTPYTHFASISVKAGHILFTAGSPKEKMLVAELELASGAIEVLHHSSSTQLDPGYLSIAQSIEFPTENGLTAHAFFYPPHNQDYIAPTDEKPPLLVMSHGGPTSATNSVLDEEVQYWTSRGIAVLDVNYGGSSGYGRDYRQRLGGEWGVVDVDDCANGARYLVEQGLVDGKRLMITGGSAGGYTTLCALTFRDVFKAGASHYGIGDLEIFVHDTHKYESRYLESLVGPFPEASDLYHQRSAIHYTDQLNCPLILFQGSEDAVVPPNQSRMMYEAAKAKGLPVAYIEFEGEQHGFRKAKNIKRALDGELYFYSRVFGFELADAVEQVEIQNL